MKFPLSLLLVLTLFAEVSAQNFNWNDSTLWYEGSKRLSAKHINAAQPDVFYVLPTCVFAWQDARGVTHYNADPYNPAHRKAWQLSAELADTIFSVQANLFLPYYPQTTFGTPDDATHRAAADTARSSVIQAFKHYLAHYNGGRPFILAGFSQGARMVVELLKQMDNDTYRRLIAAYVVGCGITAADTVPGVHNTRTIRLAQDSLTCGVTVCYNSVTTPSAINPSLCGGNIACINPVTWTTAATPALLLPAHTQPEADDPRFPYGTAVVPASSETPVTVAVDTVRNVLIVSGINPSRYHLPSLAGMFPEGNLHLQELFFYADHLRRNVIQRSRAYMTGR